MRSVQHPGRLQGGLVLKPRGYAHLLLENWQNLYKYTDAKTHTKTNVEEMIRNVCATLSTIPRHFGWL